MPLDTQPLTDDYIRYFYKSLACPRALTCWLLYSNSEHTQLVELETNPSDYLDYDSFRDALAATSLLSKADFLDLPVDREAVALKKFEDAESKCKEANIRIDHHRFKNPMTCSILMMVARKIDHILGSFDAEEFVDGSGWGPGATTNLSRRRAHSHKKYESATHITLDAYDFVSSFFSSAYPSWKAEFKIDTGAEIVTVPKNAKTDRTIAIEPGLNLWFQKGIGLMLRRRLRRVGLNLNTQRNNQYAARLASITGDYATIDFSAASDTVTKSLVREILPSRWFLVMDLLRSKNVTLPDGTVRHLEKFSSMGNGFTFELETLIFYTIAFAVCESLGLETKWIRIFGDDVILPSAAVEFYTDVCNDLGFTINKQKSFSSGYFRESCGSYYYNGKNCKPIFLKKELTNDEEICKAANNLRRFAHSRVAFGCDRSFRFLFEKLSGVLGKKFPRIPDGLGDIGLISNITEPYVKYSRPKHGIEGYYVKVYTRIPKSLQTDSWGLLLTRLKEAGMQDFSYVYSRETLDDWCAGVSATICDGLETSGSGNRYSCKVRFRKTRKRILIPRWPDLGDWI